jgi:poly(3-hydroxybutyrate) depolymerase
MKNTKQPNPRRQNGLFRGALKMLTRVILIIGCATTALALNAQETSDQDRGKQRERGERGRRDLSAGRNKPKVAEEVRESTDDLKLKPGINLLSIKFKDIKRDLYIELPQDLASGTRYPIVFGFHGDGGPMTAYRDRLSPFVKKLKIIGVSIQGTAPDGGFGLSKESWNYSNGTAVKVDDIAFITYLVEYLVESGVGDLARVYATGGSSGGLFSYRLAVDTDLFAAIAPTKCGMIKGHHEPDLNTAPLSIMQCIGNEDKSYNGSSNK